MLLENKYVSFQVHCLALWFDTSRNVDMDYDLKLWVWQDQMPQLRTVGGFDSHLQLQLSQMHWRTLRNTVRATGQLWSKVCPT